MKTISRYLLVVIAIWFSDIVSRQGFAQSPCTMGYAGIYPCANVDLMSHLPLDSIGGVGGANDVWGWTDSLSGREFAIIGLRNGTSFIEVTDPVHPVYLGILPTATTNSSWRDMKTYNNHVFIVSEATGHGVQSFDLRMLLAPQSIPDTFAALDHLTDFGNGRAHNIVGLTDAGYMIVVGASGSCSGGLTFVNVQDPGNMIVEGCFSADGYTHDAVCFVYQGPDTEHTGKQICLASNEDSQTIVDITDKSNPISLARLTYLASQYTHQGWVTDDHRYLIFGDELDESRDSISTRTYIVDITDLDNPLDPIYYESTDSAIDHNQYIKGQFSYQANYRAGFRMLNLDSISTASLSEEAHFDIYPSDNKARFNGAWSVFPYFKSGIILISGMEQGLFVLKPKIPHVVVEANRKPIITNCGNRNLIFDLSLTSYAGYSDPVELSVVGIPAGSTAIFAANPITPDNNTTLTIHHPMGFYGKYNLIIQARGPQNNTAHDVSVSFISEDTLPHTSLHIDDAYLALHGESGSYKANNRVEGNATIKSGNAILFSAGKEIELPPTFSVESGATFEASINSCWNPDSPP